MRLRQAFVYALVCTTVSASAQGPGRDARSRRGPARSGGALALLADSEVQQALGLDEEQIGYLGLLAEDAKASQEEFTATLEGLDRDERGERIRDYQSKRGKENEESVLEILGPEKVERFKQIRLQVGGPLLLLTPEVAREVGIDEEQQSTMRSSLREIFMSLRRGRREEGGNRGQEMRTQMGEKLLALLTDEQKERWEELKGKPAAINLERLREQTGPERRRGRPENRDRRETAR